ncbi:hypothetical protein D3C72_1955780 [compost metagenome]
MPGFNPELGQPRTCGMHGLGQMGAQGVHMFAVAAVRQCDMGDIGGQPASCKAGGDLQVNQAVYPVGARRHKAAAQRGRQGLGKAADVDDAGEAIQRGQPRCRAVLEIRKDVILNDDQASAFGKFEQPVGGDC